MVTIASLTVYPIKSCGGIDLTTMHFDDVGPSWDRRWMVVDANGEFLTQRAHPKLALVKVGMDALCLVADAPQMAPLRIPLKPDGTATVPARVWGHVVTSTDCGAEATQWFSELLGCNARLVRFPDDAVRWASRKYAPGPRKVGFADGYPVLLVGSASLQQLNDRCGQELSMRRFRPNVVVDGSAPFAEDEWRELRMEELTLEVCKPCDRCSITTLDPETSSYGREPLRTLATFRRSGNKVLFGQNCTVRGAGPLRLGQRATPVLRNDRA